MQTSQYLLWERCPAVLREITKEEQRVLTVLQLCWQLGKHYELQTRGHQMVRALELYTRHECFPIFVQRINFPQAYVWWQPVVPRSVGKVGVLTVHSIAQKVRKIRYFLSFSQFLPAVCSFSHIIFLISLFFSLPLVVGRLHTEEHFTVHE